MELIGLEETIRIAREESEYDGHYPAEQWLQWEEEAIAEQEAERAYERYMDYRAWLRDGAWERYEEGRWL